MSLTIASQNKYGAKLNRESRFTRCIFVDAYPFLVKGYMLLAENLGTLLSYAKCGEVLFKSNLIILIFAFSVL
jgi:hypothetical protein